VEGPADLRYELKKFYYRDLCESLYRYPPPSKCGVGALAGAEIQCGQPRAAILRETVAEVSYRRFPAGCSSIMGGNKNDEYPGWAIGAGHEKAATFEVKGQAVKAVVPRKHRDVANVQAAAAGDVGNNGAAESEAQDLPHPEGAAEVIYVGIIVADRAWQLQVEGVIPPSRYFNN
jgi:hypothetical protein